jgi:hypothetical protein
LGIIPHTYQTIYRTNTGEILSIDLKSISKNIAKPPRVAIYGPPGIGKTTFAAGAPNPVFILTEEGLGDLEVSHFPVCTSFEEVLECLATLGKEDHDFKTVVIDSLDALELMVWASTCKRLNVPSIETPGYGRGYIEAQSEWRMLFSYITALRDEKGLTAILIAHSAYVHVEDPEYPAYDTSALKLNKRAAAMTTEYCDVVGFCSLKMFTKIDETASKEKRARAIATQDRVLRLSVSPSYTAKNRYHMPEVIPLSWEEFAKKLPGGN